MKRQLRPRRRKQKSIGSPTFIIDSDTSDSDSDCEIIDKEPEVIVLDEDKEAGSNSTAEEMKRSTEHLFYEDRTPANAEGAKVVPPPNYNLRIKVVVGSDQLNTGPMRCVENDTIEAPASKRVMVEEPQSNLTDFYESISDISDFLLNASLQTLSDNQAQGCSTPVQSRQVTAKGSGAKHTMLISVPNNENKSTSGRTCTVTSSGHSVGAEVAGSNDEDISPTIVCCDDSTVSSTSQQNTIVENRNQPITSQTAKPNVIVISEPSEMADDSVIFVSETQYQENTCPKIRPFGSNFIRFTKEAAKVSPVSYYFDININFSMKPTISMIYRFR